MKRCQRTVGHRRIRRQAQASLAEFTLYTKPDFRMGWFHRTLCDLLDEFLADVVAKKSPRLLVQAPPQHGKSELVSRRFPAYALGRHPHLRVMACSYAASLAFELSGDLQRIMDGELFHKLFPNVGHPGRVRYQRQRHMSTRTVWRSRARRRLPLCRR
jgi:hypothetical protein